MYDVFIVGKSKLKLRNSYIEDALYQGNRGRHGT